MVIVIEYPWPATCHKDVIILLGYYDLVFDNNIMMTVLVLHPAPPFREERSEERGKGKERGRKGREKMEESAGQVEGGGRRDPVA